MEYIKRHKKWFIIGGGALAAIVLIQIFFGPANL